MERANGSPQLYLAASGMGSNRVVESSARLKLVIARLEDSRAILTEVGERDTARLVAMALLQLRMRMHHIGDAELKALCDAIEAEPHSESDQSKASGDRGSA